MTKNVTINLKCTNIAPLVSLNEQIECSSIRLAILASNGSGKTFLSRLFRLTESSNNNKSINFITLGQNNAHFSFKVKDRNNNIVENFEINFSQNSPITIPSTYYIYHTFNQDYIEENIYSLNYDKNSEVDGYILGRINIDLSLEEKKLEELKKNEIKISEDIKNQINSYIDIKITRKANFNRLTEYKSYLNFSAIVSNDNSLSDVSDSTDNLISRNDISSQIPENLQDIKEIDFSSIFQSDLKTSISLIKEDLETIFELSSLSKEIKDKIKNKSSFIKDGLNILNTNDESCPFCEQNLKNDLSYQLLLLYNQYFNDSEAKTIEKLKKYKEYLVNLNNSLDKINIETNSTIDNFNSVNRYINLPFSLKSLDIGQSKILIIELLSLLE